MKLRVQSNSLRLRLSETEVTQFKQTGQIEERIQFGPSEDQVLRYVLAFSANTPVVTATFEQAQVTVLVPESIAAQWVNSEQNGFEGFIDNGTERGLKILVEKDLDCFH
ncbi:DUF7009 family protein [Adhaeribacter aquaticus]|uniref:DUF7009 family protein n=1 Tax=Adhaeribacter aquaticus TaxID=299567 RepID=UPI000479BF33|nr:hypothetical protein [Adhaeribacter aquaticus]